MIKSPLPNLTFSLPSVILFLAESWLLPAEPWLLKEEGVTVLKKKLRRRKRRFMMSIQFCEQKENLDTKVWTQRSLKKDRNTEFNTCRLKAALLL
jgi:hypothetical protein